MSGKQDGGFREKLRVIVSAYGSDYHLNLPQTMPMALDDLERVIDQEYAERQRAAITYDSIALGWENDEHFRVIVAIRAGMIIGRYRVSDEALRNRFPRHGRVITQYHIEDYAKAQLERNKEDTPM